MSNYYFSIKTYGGRVFEARIPARTPAAANAILRRSIAKQRARFEYLTISEPSLSPERNDA